MSSSDLRGFHILLGVIYYDNVKEKFQYSRVSHYV